VQYSNTKELGKLLYTEYLYPLEIAAVLLLVAIIAAIALTLRQRKDSKHMDPSRAGARARQRPPADHQDAAHAVAPAAPSPKQPAAAAETKA
jgi:NADH-quinone oxidoreductase subunit J